MFLLLLCLVSAEFLKYWELRNLRIILQEKTEESAKKTPPKGRGSFVVKRFEERIKEALYE